MTITTIDELTEAIRKVVNYNWHDEQRDYEQQEEEGRKSHIFLVLEALDEFVG